MFRENVRFHFVLVVETVSTFSTCISTILNNRCSAIFRRTGRRRPCFMFASMFHEHLRSSIDMATDVACIRLLDWLWADCTCVSTTLLHVVSGYITSTITAHQWQPTFDAILYLHKCSCAPLLNFSPQWPISGSAKGEIWNRILWGIFAAILSRFRRTL